jgi:transcriptional regulator with XRE-family HTH domain
LGTDRKPVAVHFGRNLRRFRDEADISQEELGFLAALHRTEIGLLERGRREPKLDTIIKLADALSVSLDQLCGEASWKREGSGLGEFEFRDLCGSAAMSATRGLGNEC